MKGIGVFIRAGVAILGSSLLFLGCTTEWTADTVRSCTGLHNGDLVRLTDSDNAVHSGVFCEMTRMDFLTYVEHAKKMTSNADKLSRAPVPGERIMFTTVLEPDHVWNGALMGFCTQYLWVKLNGESEISHFYLNGVTRIVGVDGRLILSGELRTMIADNEVPLMTLLTMKNDVDTLRFAINNIKHIELIKPAALAGNVNALSGF